MDSTMVLKTIHTHWSQQKRLNLCCSTFITLILIQWMAIITCQAQCTDYPPLLHTDSLHSLDTGQPNIPSCHLLTLPLSSSTTCRTGCAKGYYATQASSWTCVVASWSGQGAACSNIPPLAQPYPYSPTPNWIPHQLGLSNAILLQSDQATGRMFASGVNDTTDENFIVEFDLGAAADVRSVDNYRRVWILPVAVDVLYYTPAVPSIIFAYCDNGQTYNMFNRTDGSHKVLTTTGTLTAGYLAAPNVANLIITSLVSIGSFAFDANMVMFFIIQGSASSRTSFFPNLAVFLPSSGQVIPMNGTELFYQSSYGHAPPLYLYQLQFGGGYLWAIDNGMVIYRTKLPYSGFSSGTDLVSNPFIAIEREDRFGGINGFYVEPVFGNLFVNYADPVGQLVQYFPIGSGNYQTRVYDTPCSQPAIRFVGQAAPTAAIALDMTILPNRLYFVDSAINQLHYFNIELSPPMSQYELGCLDDPEPLPFYAPTLDPTQVLPFQTASTIPPLPANFILSELGPGTEMVLTSDNNGKIYVGKKNQYTVYEYVPGTALNNGMGVDLTSSQSWDLANTSLTLQFIIYNTNDHLVYVIDSQGNIATINPSNSISSILYNVTSLGVAFNSIGFSPSNQMYGTSNRNGVSNVSVIGGLAGSPTVTVTQMAFAMTNQNSHSLYSPHTSFSEGTDLRNPIFRNGYLYFHGQTHTQAQAAAKLRDSASLMIDHDQQLDNVSCHIIRLCRLLYCLDLVAGYIVRTLFPYSSFGSDQDFVLNPLIPILDGEGLLYGSTIANIGGYTIEPTTGTLITAYWTAYTSLFNHTTPTSTIVQHQLIGTSYLQSPYSSPCLPTAVKPVSSFDLAIPAPVIFAFDLSVGRLYWFTSGDTNLQYAPITLASSLPQASLGCAQACTTPPTLSPHMTTNCSVASSYAHATICVNTCASGYSGTSMTYRCTFGSWTTTDLVGLCSPTPCSSTPPYTAFGSNVTSGCPLSAYPIANGTICSVGCATNYTGTSTLAYQCLTGTWISTNASNHISCVQSCPLVLPVGAVSAGCPTLLDGHGAGACLLSPATGYQMAGGAPFMTCTNGTLSTTAVFTPAPCSTTNLVTSSSLALGTCPGSPPGSLASGSSCQLACANGWTSTNYTTISCSYGVWSGTAPICMKQCSNLNTTVILGATSGNCTSVIDGNNGQCQLSQTNGYTLSGIGGSLTMICTNGTYSPLPILTPNSCYGNTLAPQLTTRMAVNTCPAGSAILGSGSSCQLGCVSTFTSITGGQQDCLLGNWSGMLPVCKQQCAAFNIIAPLPTGVTYGNCTVILDGNSGSCLLTLSSGYTLVGGTLKPICIDGAYPTSLPQVTANPSIGSDLIAQGLLVYPMDYGSCPIGSAALASGGSCQLNCTSGWTCSSCGQMNSTAGQWSGTTPICRKQCQLILGSQVIGGTPGNCTQTIDGNNGTCQLTVSSGYALTSGSLTMTCTNGTYSPLPTLSPNPCYGASLTFSSPVSVGACPGSISAIASPDTCQLGCINGWTSVTGGLQSCLAGNWSGTLPICQKQCPILATPPIYTSSGNCTTVLDGNSGTCVLVPWAGYTVTSGSLTLTCTNGSYSSAPTLALIPCQGSDLTTTRMMGQPISYGTCPNNVTTLAGGGTCQLNCTSGYTCNTCGQLTCSSGTWLGQSPVCRKQCPILSPIPIGATAGNCTSVVDGNSGQCQLTLVNGYTLTSGSLTMICTNGTYSSSPVLTPTPCSGSDLAPQLTSIMAPNTCPSTSSTPLASGLSCQLGCTSTYTSISGGQQTCLLGNWSGILPACKLQCQPYNVLVTLPTGIGPGNCTVILDGNSATCMLSLLPGYTLTLHSLTQMCVDGAYPTPIPVVTANPCIGIDLINQGFLVYPMDSGTCPIGSATLVSGGSCQLNCTSGWTCSSCGRMNSTAGQWSGITPMCYKQCSPLVAPPPTGTTIGNCTQILDGQGGQCLLTLVPGYFVSSGTLALTCSNGTYSSLPNIQPVPCPLSSLSPTAPYSTYGNCTTNLTPGQQCRFGCITGSTTSAATLDQGFQYCLFGGSWSGQQPRCMQQCSQIVPPLGSAPGTCLTPIDGNDATCSLTLQNGFSLMSGSMSIGCHNGTIAPLPTFEATYTPTYSASSTGLFIAPGSTLTRAMLDLPIVVNLTSISAIGSSSVNVMTTFSGALPKFTSSNAMNFVLNLTCNLLQATCPTQLLLDGVDQNVVWISGVNQIKLSLTAQANHTIDVVQPIDVNTNTLQTLRLQLIEPPTDSCFNIICQNSGTCLPQPSLAYSTSYTCYCSAAFTGSLCQTSLTPLSNGTSGSGSSGTSSGGTSVTPPVSVVYPQAVITAPTSVSACDSLILDGRLSYNLGPISLSPYYHWSLISIMLNNIEILDSTSPRYVLSFATTTWTAAGSSTLTGTTTFIQTETISISPLNMIDGATYTFQLIVGNVLLTSTPTTTTITKLAPASNALPWTPTISIQSPSQINRASINHFTSVIIPSTCQSIPVDVVYTFGWSVQVKGRYVNDTTTGRIALNTTVNDIPRVYRQYSAATRDLDIPINYLYVGYVYSIGLVVDLVSATGVSSRRLLASAQSVTSISAVDVSPQPSPVQASIIGGARSRRADQTVSISGEQSYDPDYTGSNSLDGVTFVWSCQNSLDHSLCSLSNSISLTASTLTLPVNSLAVGSYVITVTVTSTTGTSRSASSGIVLTITPAPTTVNSITPPIVSILNAPTRINSVSILRLVATALSTTNTTVENLKFMWSITSSTTSVLPNLFDSNNLGAPVNTSTLVLLGSQLTPGVYELTVLVTDPYFIDPTTNQAPQSFATVSITVNSIPQPGTCQVAPTTGITLNTSFSLSCSNWYEPLSANYQPFTYAVEYADVTNIPANTTLSDGSFHQLTDYSLLSTASFTLPIGQLRLRAFIRDTVGAYASVDLDVSVTPPAVDTSTTAAANAYVSGVISTQLSTAVQSGSNQDAANIIQQLVTVLNISDSAIVDAGTTAVVGDLLDALIVVWEQCSDQANTTQHPTESTATPQKPVSNICVTLVSQTLALLTQHQSVLNFTSTKLTKATNLLSSIISTTIASNIEPSAGTSVSLGSIASNLMVQCSQLDDISELVQRVLQIDQSHAVAGEQLSLHTNNFDAAVVREFVSAGTALKLPTGQTVTLSPEAMASYAAQVNQGLNISTIDTSTTGAVEMDTRVVTFNSEWSSCRGSDSLSNIQTIELTTPDGRPINIGSLGHAISFDVPLNSNKTKAALDDAQSKLCPNEPFNATDAANKAFSCSFWNTTTHSYSTDGCISRGVRLSYNSSVPSILTCDCNHLTEFAILYQEATSEYGGCPSPTSLGHWSYLFFFFWYVAIGLVSAYQLLRVLRRFRFGKYWLMTTEHTLICTTCVFRALNMIIFWKLYSELSLSLQTILSGMPYVFLNWIFTLVIVAWASIWHASERGETTSDPFKPYQNRFILVNSVISGSLFLIFLSMASTTNLDQISKLNQWGVGLTSGIQIALAIFFMLYGTLLVRSLTKDFVSPYAKKLSLVAVSLSVAFLISASILIFSILDEATYQDHLKLFDSFYYGLDLVGLCIIMGLFSKSVNDVINSNDGSVGTKNADSGSVGGTRKVAGSVLESVTNRPKNGTIVEKDVVLQPKRMDGWQKTNKNTGKIAESPMRQLDTIIQTTTVTTTSVRIQSSQVDVAHLARRYAHTTDDVDEIVNDLNPSTSPLHVSSSVTQTNQEGVSTFNLPHRFHEDGDHPPFLPPTKPRIQPRSSSYISSESDSSTISSGVSSSDNDTDLDEAASGVSKLDSNSVLKTPTKKLNGSRPYQLRSPTIHIRAPLSHIISDSHLLQTPTASPTETPISPTLISPFLLSRPSVMDLPAAAVANGSSLIPVTESIAAPVPMETFLPSTDDSSPTKVEVTAPILLADSPVSSSMMVVSHR